MLAVWRAGTLPIGMSNISGKQGLVELYGASPTKEINAPEKMNNNYFKVNRIFNKNLFIYQGMVDGENCTFKVDMGSDISILNEKLVRGPRRQFKINKCSLKYPTEEDVLVNYKVIVRVELGRYSLDVPMLLAKILDDCILGADFLELIGLEKVFESVFGNIESCEDIVKYPCSRMISLKNKVPCFLETPFEENSKNLDSIQREIFADFLNEFQDVFFEDLIAGNCEILEHEINLNDCRPIKQAP